MLSLRTSFFLTRNTLTRQFQTSSLLLKKKAAKGKAAPVEEEPEIVDPNIYVKELTTKFDKSIELYQKELNEKRQGSFNSKIFDKLVLKNGRSFKDMATTALKGKGSLLITVFDPNEVKNIVSAILAADLNLNPERVSTNNQQLKVPLPPPTTESKQQLCKELKTVFEKYKQSQSKASLGHIRTEVMKELKSLQKKDESIKKIIQHVEKIHKDYVNKMTEQLKQAEKNVMG
ncbi:Ribosome-recycling factor, mitochondrial [Nakaseomyces bracarensis]|uniref:Ribosome-recycling factor, mitochondrial n=1 Tax=Nakaseomyces bracarensis TaxID=273131 RepID=A0ABR4NRY4_9SACH